MTTGVFGHISTRDASRLPASLPAFLIVLVLLIRLPTSTSAQEAVAYVGQDTVTVGERFSLVVSVSHDAGAEVVFPDSVGFGSVAYGDLEVLAVSARGRRPDPSADSDAVIDSILYEVTTFAIDTAVVAPIPVPLVAGSDTTTVETAPFIIPVASLVSDTAQDVRDLAPLASFPGPLWPWLVGALLLLLALALFVILRRRRRSGGEAPLRPRKTTINPYDAALQKLASLEEVDLDTEANVKPFFDDLSEVLRTYLSKVLHIHALEETTRDIIMELRSKADPPAKMIPFDTPDDVRTLLDLADLVKFADFYPAAERARQSIASTREIIETVERNVRFRSETEPDPNDMMGTENGSPPDDAH